MGLAVAGEGAHLPHGRLHTSAETPPKKKQKQDGKEAAADEDERSSSESAWSIENLKEEANHLGSS